MDLKDRLVSLRNNRKWTQLEVAEKLGVKRARYNAWEQGISQPNIEVLGKIADLYGVSIDYLVGKSHIENAELDRKAKNKPDIRVIERAAINMTPEQRQEAIKMWEILFKDIMKKAMLQEGVDSEEEDI